MPPIDKKDLTPTGPTRTAAQPPATPTGTIQNTTGSGGNETPKRGASRPADEARAATPKTTKQG